MPILKQHKKSRNVILSLYILFIIILGISYAYYSETLSVTGVASIDGYVWPENILPALPEQTENGVNFNESFKSEYIEGNAISNQNRFENINESYDVATSTYKLNITKTYVIEQLVNPKRENFNLNFKIKNLSNLTWENGNTTYEIDSWSNLIDNVNISIDKTSLAPNDIATLNMQFRLTIYGKFGIVEYNDVLTIKANYTVDGQTKTTTVIIDFI